jgi:hypothetical protein
MVVHELALVSDGFVDEETVVEDRPREGLLKAGQNAR